VLFKEVRTWNCLLKSDMARTLCEALCLVTVALALGSATVLVFERSFGSVVAGLFTAILLVVLERVCNPPSDSSGSASSSSNSYDRPSGPKDSDR
jgi:hypothetical protein